MSPETGTIEIEPIDAVPEHAVVRHYDELDEEIKDRLPQLLDHTDSDGMAAFDDCDCEVVKFTEYYRIVRG